jgi:hypothetical protein
MMLMRWRSQVSLSSQLCAAAAEGDSSKIDSLLQKTGPADINEPDMVRISASVMRWSSNGEFFPQPSLFPHALLLTYLLSTAGLIGTDGTHAGI